MIFHFYNSTLNSFIIFSFFSAGITIFSRFLEFSSITDFGFTILSLIFFPISSPVASATLWASFSKAVCIASSHVLIAVFNTCFSYFLDRFLTNDKNPYRITYHFYLLISNVRLTLFSISNDLPF